MTDMNAQESFTSFINQEPSKNSTSSGSIITTINPDLFQQRPMTRQLLVRFQQRRSEGNPISKNKDLLRSAAASRTTTTTHPTVMVLTGIGLVSGTYLISCILSDCLAQWEWFQLWRYTWPFGIGALYLTGNILPANLSTSTGADQQLCIEKDISFLDYDSNVWMGQSILSRTSLIVLSLGMMIGGAYDVWMPVYMTGPNVLTAAGIGQDAAVGLFLWTFWQTSISTTTTIMTPKATNSSSIAKPSWFLLSSILLLAQLYVLGEGSWDELVFSKLPL